MCEVCGCGVGKGVPRAVEAVAPVTLAAIPVRIVEPSAAGKRRVSAGWCSNMFLSNGGWKWPHAESGK